MKLQCRSCGAEIVFEPGQQALACEYCGTVNEIRPQGAPDYTPPGQRPRRYVLPEGPNSPIGVAWLGLDLPGYGIHGTPRPATIGNAESHGCFRLANWNAARLYAMCPVGTSVLILP